MDWEEIVARNRDLVVRAREARARVQKTIAVAEHTVREVMESAAAREGLCLAGRAKPARLTITSRGAACAPPCAFPPSSGSIPCRGWG
jgi:hypothetical protein